MVIEFVAFIFDGENGQARHSKSSTAWIRNAHAVTRQENPASIGQAPAALKVAEDNARGGVYIHRPSRMVRFAALTDQEIRGG